MVVVVVCSGLLLSRFELICIQVTAQHSRSISTKTFFFTTPVFLLMSGGGDGDVSFFDLLVKHVFPDAETLAKLCMREHNIVPKCLDESIGAYVMDSSSSPSLEIAISAWRLL